MYIYTYKKTKQRPVYIILATKLLFIRTVICNLLSYDSYDKIKIRETKEIISRCNDDTHTIKSCRHLDSDVWYVTYLIHITIYFRYLNFY